jgi:tetratricopeptide (TPR) repeat protein
MEVVMKIIAVITAILVMMSFSLSLAQEDALKKAYSLYYKGQKETAIKIMEEYVVENPDPAVFYFLGYAYYEMEQMDRAAQYFNRAFVRSPFYSPMSEEEEKKENGNNKEGEKD